VRKPDILIVGAGIAGLSIARGLLLQGCKKLTVLAPPAGDGRVEHGFTSSGAGIVSGQFWDENLAAVAKRSFGILNDLIAGSRIRAHRIGMAQIALSNRTAGMLKRLEAIRLQLDWPMSSGLPLSLGFAQKFRRSIVHATFATDDLWLDPVALTKALCKGIRIVKDRLVEIRNARGMIHAVTGRGVIKSDLLILSTGVWTGDFVRDIRKSMVVYKSQVALFKVAGIRYMFHVLDTGIYSRPHSTSSILVGDGDVLWNKSCSEEAARSMDDFWQAGTREQIAEIFGRRPEMGKGWAGLVAMTKSGRPLVRPLDKSRRVWLFTGFGGNGLALAPALGEQLATQILK
jgi:glycine/D-amino acid oxidase-like deaminating enzyme